MTRKPPAARIALSAALLILALALVPAAVAGKGGGKGGHTSGTSSLSLVLLDSTDGLAHWGQKVTFNVSTTATTQPNVDLTCSKSGTVVYGATTGFYDGYPWPWTQIMTLSSKSWTGGDADCAALLYYFKGTRKMALATLKFHAYA